MSYAPPTLTDLGTYWTQQGGVNLGIVGNQRHCAGYHLGKDRIFSDCACKPDGTCQPGKRWSDYSVSRTRDKANLTNGAAAIDLGALNGTFTELQKFSVWLVQQCQAGKCRDIREVIYSPDGKVVLRWESSDNQLHSGEGQGDLSHLKHTHLSFFRDSEARDKRPYFAPYFALPDSSTETFMNYTYVDGQPDSGPGTVTVAEDRVSYIHPDGTTSPIAKGISKHTYGLVRFAPDGKWPGELAYPIGADGAFLLKRNTGGSFKADATQADKTHKVETVVDGVVRATVEV